MSDNTQNNQNASLNNNKAFAIIKKVLSGILSGILALLFIIVVWLAIDKFILKSPVPSILGYATLTVETGSMESELQIGDMILIKDTGDYKIGDIITYIHEGDKIPTTHRIINYTENGFITKGDANNVKDTDEVTVDIIIGEVVKVFPKVGLFAVWVQEEGWLYIIAALIIVILGSFILKIDGSTDEEQEQNTVGASTARQNDTESTEEAFPIGEGGPLAVDEAASSAESQTVNNEENTTPTEE